MKNTIDIKFQVERVIYKKDKFFILKVKIIKALGGSISKNMTLKGNFLTEEVFAKDIYKAKCEIVEDYNWGFQLLLTEAPEIIINNRQDTIVTHLKRNVKGVGKDYIERLVEKLGMDTLYIIASEKKEDVINKITEVMPLSKANKIYDFVKKESIMKDLMLFASGGWGFVGKENEIFEKYGAESIVELRKDPYGVMFSVDMPFEVADKIADINGIEKKDEVRLRGIVTYAFNLAMNTTGSVAITLENIVEAAKIVSKDDIFSKSDIEKEMVKMIKNELIVEENDENGNKLYFLKKVQELEKSIAKHVKRLNKDTIIGQKEADLVKKVEKQGELTNEQLNALKMVLNTNLSIITGGAGVGKTFTIKKIIRVLEELGQSIMLIAPTGKAANRMTEMTGKEAKTIHSALGIMGFGRENDKEVKKLSLDADVIVIDETSMIDAYLFEMLVKNIKDNTKVVLIGDVNQLPSIGPGNILSDLIESGVVKVAKLTRIFRQDDKSNIVSVSYDILNKKTFDDLEIHDKSKDCYFMKKDNDKETSEEVLNIFDNFIKSGDGINDIMILAPMKGYLSGVDNLNRILQEKYNPCDDNEDEFDKNGLEVFRVGDRVINNKNNRKLGITNGQLGTVTDIIKKGTKKYVLVIFDDMKEEIEFNKTNAENLSLAYAITIHKSQGSSAKKVIIPIIKNHEYMISNNLLYTAITRAEEKCIIVGNEEIFNDGIVKKCKKRKSKLIEKLTRN